jgi:hypothetical protein
LRIAVIKMSDDQVDIDHQLKFDRLHHWQVGGLLALEDAVDVAGRAPYWSI